MAALDIRPHSPRISGWAVTGLMALGVAAFAAGMIHQIAPTGPLPFPPPPMIAQRAAPAAAPAPDLQYASAERPAPRAAPAEIPPNTSAPHDPAAVTDDAAQAPPAVDASATAADAAPQPPEPQAPPQPPTESAPQA